MPFDYYIDHGNKVLIIRGTGLVTMEDRLDCVDSMFKDASINDQYNVAIDVSEVLNGPSSDDINKISLLVEKLQSKFGRRVAIINTRVGHATFSGLISISTICGSDKVKAFMSKTETLNWLCKTSLF